MINGTAYFVMKYNNTAVLFGPSMLGGVTLAQLAFALMAFMLTTSASMIYPVNYNFLLAN
jgi:hypothetical protein